MSNSDRVLTRARTRGAPWFTSWALSARGVAEFRFGSPGKAAHLLRQALGDQVRFEDRWGSMWTTETLAWTAAETLEFEHAAQLLGGTDRLRAQTGAIMTGLPVFAVMRAHAVRQCQDAMDDTRFTDSYDRGASSKDSEIFTLALEQTPAAARRVTGRSSTGHLAQVNPQRATAPLSSRRMEIARLIAQGMSNPEIASKLFLSKRTVESHVRDILDRRGLNNRQQIAAWITEYDAMEGERH